MPTFTITVTTAEGIRVMKALCDQAGVTPPTQAAALAELKVVLITIVQKYERDQATRTAVEQVVDPTPITPT